MLGHFLPRASANVSDSKPVAWFAGNSIVILFFVTVVCSPQTVRADAARGPDSVVEGAVAGSGTEILRWRRLMAEVADLDEFTKVTRVNQHLNRIAYVEDAVKWGRPDYWATPREFLEHGGGDCEDFSIAKYFLLQEIGVPVTRLRLVYARIPATGEAHMVVAYFRGDEVDPLVLDNLTDAISPLSKRDDLLPYFGFNSSGLWLTGASGRFLPAATSSRYSQWSDLEGRVAADHSLHL